MPICLAIIKYCFALECQPSRCKLVDDTPTVSSFLISRFFLHRAGGGGGINDAKADDTVKLSTKLTTLQRHKNVLLIPYRVHRLVESRCLCHFLRAVYTHRTPKCHFLRAIYTHRTPNHFQTQKNALQGAAQLFSAAFGAGNCSSCGHRKLQTGKLPALKVPLSHTHTRTHTGGLLWQVFSP